MLKAHLHGKLRRNEDGEACLLEDTTTAILFERLAFLPDDTLIRILFDPSLWGGQEMGPLPRTVEDIAFWPYWSWSGPERKSVEPDVAITFDSGLLVIEAKRSDRSGGQDAMQIADEWWAAWRKQTPAWILAVSGLRNPRADLPALRQAALNRISTIAKNDHSADFHLGYGSWRTLFGLIERALDSDQAAHRRLLASLRDGLAAHGVQVSRPCWLSEPLDEGWAAMRPSAGAEHGFPLWFPRLDALGGIRTDPTYFNREGLL